ncbi:MAG: polyprenyl synthetase family protein [Angustibacter sp.]
MLLPLDDPPGNPLDADDLRVRVQKVLDDHVRRQVDRLSALGPDLDPLIEVVTDLLSGGKRLRPAFCYWGWRGAGGDDVPGIVEAASAFEMFHAAALLHDDVMDDSSSRRGQVAAHRRMAAVHQAAGWTGDGDRFGTAAAILAGDLCLAWSDELFTECGLPAASVARARSLFDVMRTQLMGGQYLDLLAQAVPESDGDGDLERARRVIRFKSAKYSVEHPLLIGGSLAGAAPGLLACYSAYGIPLGEAFQLRDDILGVFGDPERTGKPAGDDLREGKRTVLIAEALAHATPGQASTLRQELGNPALDAEGVAVLRAIITDTGALERVEARIESQARQARDALNASTLTTHARTVLNDLVTAATARIA